MIIFLDEFWDFTTHFVTKITAHKRGGRLRSLTPSTRLGVRGERGDGLNMHSSGLKIQRRAASGAAGMTELDNKTELDPVEERRKPDSK